VDRRVLIVDDDPAVRRLLETYLTQGGYQVLQAANGREGLELMAAEAPPIVITDWMMPEMDGLELCRRLRGHEGIRFVYVVMLTAHDDTNALEQAIEAGADDFLTKPVNKAELKARLRVGEHITRLEADLAKRKREIHRLNAEMALANDKLRRMATTDELTGLLNRREAMNRLRQLWAAVDRYGHPFSCIMLDLDHFKRLNDSHGHAAGDRVLHEVGQLLHATVRGTDLACRIGGEEFLVLCPNTSAAGAAACAEHLRAAVAEHPFRHEDAALRVTISLGVGEYEPGLSDAEAVLKRADEALYWSKKAGRNRVSVWNPQQATAAAAGA